MPDLCVPYTGFPSSLVLNGHIQATVADTLIPTSIKGLHGRPVRATIIPRGATNGGRKLTSRFGPRRITVNAFVHIVKVPGAGADKDGNGMDPHTDMDGYLARVNAVLNAWEAALEGALNTPFTLAWTPTGGSGKTKSVTYGFDGGEFDMTSEGEDAMIYPTVTFGLVAETD